MSDSDTPVEAIGAIPESSADPSSRVEAGRITVTFRRSGKQALWSEDVRSLLEFAEDQGLNPDFSCRAGVCGTCSTRLLEGRVAYGEEPLDEPDPGHILICCSRPVESVVLDL